MMSEHTALVFARALVELASDHGIDSGRMTYKVDDGDQEMEVRWRPVKLGVYSCTFILSTKGAVPTGEGVFVWRPGAESSDD